ncbi:SCO family protein [Aggregicoccus sp. 17bor-14]|uniref:SCO family protein n=1 Tax=Myxococcaceae TaxID=31 RepID=UPI00129C79EB|nr:MULTISPECIES: SCO family protein [Myxococcaceae]MBF5045373.1 SCO family protein [Simulacricoccus sp. 17bor-14]MRI91115.1 SCO family protein [Aggregicoccus sp. 17bor-14]
MSTPAPASPALPRRASSPLLWGVLGALLAGVLLAGAWVALRPAPEPLPDLGALPAFTFTRQDGRPFGLQQLQGHPFVANFIFTRCPTVCPLFSKKMAALQGRTKDVGARLALVSFSVDPKYDTPERLSAYAHKYGADEARWSFLTGDYEQLKGTIVGGFKISMGRENLDDADVMGIFHGTHFVLVDGRGHVRGYYDSNDAEATERLVQDAERLAREG